MKKYYGLNVSTIYSITDINMVWIDSTTSFPKINIKTSSYSSFD